MRKSVCLLLGGILCVGTWASAADIIAEGKKNYSDPAYLMQHPFAVKDGYVMVARSAKISGARQVAVVTAQRLAESQLFSLKELELDTDSIGPEYKDIFRHRLFLQYQAVAPLKCSAQNAIVLADYVRGDKYCFAAAYRLEDIKFTPADRLTVKSVFDVLRRNPKKRDELLFAELVSALGEGGAIGIDKAQLSRQYGQTFALMFCGEKVPPISEEKYNVYRSTYAKFDASTGTGVLIAAVNNLPYDRQLCSLLADKFVKLQLPKCAGIMRVRAEESGKLAILAPPAPAVKTVEKEVVPDSAQAAPVAVSSDGDAAANSATSEPFAVSSATAATIPSGEPPASGAPSSAVHARSNVPIPAYYQKSPVADIFVSPSKVSVQPNITIPAYYQKAPDTDASSAVPAALPPAEQNAQPEVDLIKFID